MRSEREMMALILDTARSDERIRAVILNGSRANPNAPRDFFQDYDVVYLVTDVAPFWDNRDWIQRFGELMILQAPEAMHDPPPSHDGGFDYLMQFTDGNRIDLGIYPIAKLNERIGDSLTLVLLDKDGLAGSLPPANESDYLPSPPSAKDFDDCCNEFWWVCPYVTKGLWREELIYALSTLDEFARPQLMKMLTWHIGARTGFAQNLGKMGKYFQQYLEPELWDMLRKTYADGSYARTWDALLTMGDLFRIAATRVADHFGFSYPCIDDKNVTAHLRHVRTLPKSAAEMY